jgi:hypothetical protein
LLPFLCFFCICSSFNAQYFTSGLPAWPLGLKQADQHITQIFQFINTLVSKIQFCKII